MKVVRLARARYTTDAIYSKIDWSSNAVYCRVSHLIALSIAPVWAALLDTTAVSRRGRSFASVLSSRKEATAMWTPATTDAIGTA